MIIGLTGLPAAGKGTVAKYLVEKYRAKSVRFSDPLRDIIKRVYQEPARESMSNMGVYLRKEFGNDVLIKTLLKDIDTRSEKLFVLDGMRYIEEFEVLSERKDFQMWGVRTDLEKRYERIIKRDENSSDKILTFEQFQQQHTLHTEQFIETLVKKAHVVIENNGSREDLIKKVDDLVKNLSL